ncbi:MAG: hypothetical protein K0R82_2598 [Flavipsychrobacter sp.]|nr:hypothetical protein [Flavipsychrobacter sp.]
MLTSIKRSFRVLMLTFMFSMGMLNVNASHFAAADIIVDWIGTENNDLTYKITLIVYKACEGTNSFQSDLYPTEPIRIRSVNGSFDLTWTVSDSPEDTLDQLCDNFKAKNLCREPFTNPGPNWPGFVRRTYDTTITLPSRQTDWIFSWTDGTRNSLIKNLVGPGGQNIYVEAGINNVFAAGPIAFAPPYTLQNPVASTAGNPYSVNAQTGTATFTPTITGLFVLAFRCNEYQKGTGIPTGHVFRDVQLSILDCAANPPDIDSIPLNLTGGANISTSVQGNTVVTCPGSELKFDINASSKSTSNKVIMESNNSVTIPASTFTVINNGSSKATGTFIWTPTPNDIGDHTLIITAKDSTCNNTQPIVLKNYRVILIKVVKGIDAGPDVTICAADTTQLYARGGEGLILQWTPNEFMNDPTSIQPKVAPTKTTEYSVYAPQLGAGCKNRDEVLVIMDTSNKVVVFPDNPIILCRPDYLQLEAKTFGGPPLSNMVCGTGNAISSTPLGTVNISSLIAGDFDSIGGTTIYMPNDARSVKQQFLVRKAEMWASGFRSATIRSIGFETPKSPDPTYEYSNFKISVKCTNLTSLVASKGFETGLTQVYTAPGGVTMPIGMNQFTLDEPYNWDTTQNLIIEICYSENATANASGSSPVVKFVATNYPATLLLKSAGTATNVCAATTSTSIGTFFSRPLFTFTYNEAVPQPFPFVWSPSTFLSDSTIRQPLAYVPASTKYIVTSHGRSGCSMIDTADIYIPQHNYTVMPADTAICFNESSPMRTTGGGFTFKWYKINDKGEYEILSNTKESTCWDCANPVLRPMKTTIYKIAVYDSVWCIDTLTAKITVKPLPDIKILTRDTFVKYGQSLQLMASGARIYNWSPVGSLNNANTSYPIATPTERTEYIAGGIGANGCRAFDTVKVDIDFRDNLFVPSGFSPNNDGKNDVFKVANLTFQRVIEFRVFNRWGQEVFMANDNRGWDGAWKGEPQDMDTYTYNIKVGFPDGYIETYRGNTTLIR